MRARKLLSRGIFNKTFVEYLQVRLSPLLALWTLILYMLIPIAKFDECLREEIVHANAQSPIFAIFVDYLSEKNMVDLQG